MARKGKTGRKNQGEELGSDVTGLPRIVVKQNLVGAGGSDRQRSIRTQK